MFTFAVSQAGASTLAWRSGVPTFALTIVSNSDYGVLLVCVAEARPEEVAGRVRIAYPIHRDLDASLVCLGLAAFPEQRLDRVVEHERSPSDLGDA